MYLLHSHGMYVCISVHVQNHNDGLYTVDVQRNNSTCMSKGLENMNKYLC